MGRKPKIETLERRLHDMENERNTARANNRDALGQIEELRRLNAQQDATIISHEDIVQDWKRLVAARDIALEQSEKMRKGAEAQLVVCGRIQDFLYQELAREVKV